MPLDTQRDPHQLYSAAETRHCTSGVSFSSTGVCGG